MWPNERGVQLRHRTVVDHVLVAADQLMFHFRAGGVGCGLGATQNSGGDLGGVGAGGGAGEEFALSKLGNNIHRLPAVGDDTVDSGVVAEMQSRGVDTLKRLYHR